MSNIEKSMNDIRTRFLVRLKKQHEMLLELANLTGDDAQHVESRESIRMTAHQIAGLAKSVGFEELGNAAFSLDQAFAKSDGTGHLRVYDNEISIRIETLIDECENTLRQEKMKS